MAKLVGSGPDPCDQDITRNSLRRTRILASPSEKAYIFSQLPFTLL
jgi:hypothetical protein